MLYAGLSISETMARLDREIGDIVIDLKSLTVTGKRIEDQAQTKVKHRHNFFFIIGRYEDGE